MSSSNLNSRVRWTDWILPVVIIIVGFTWSYYVITYPTDMMVANFLTTDRLLQALTQHIYLIATAAALAIITALPLGLLLTRPLFKPICGVVVAIINVLQSIPSFAVIALIFSVTGVGARTAIIAIWVYSLLPILNNTITGIRGVDISIIDSARGMGMTKLVVLFKIEVPLALPVIIAGIRTAIVISVGTAVIAAFIGAGGLGDFIVAGKNTSRYSVMLIGAGLASLLALLFDSLTGLLEKALKNM